MRYTAKLHIWQSKHETTPFGIGGVSLSVVTGKGWKGLLLLPPNVRIEIDGCDPDDVRKRALSAAQRMLSGPDKGDIVEGTHAEADIELTV